MADYKIILHKDDGSYNPELLSPKVAVKRHREGAERLYKALEAELYPGVRKTRKSYSKGRKDECQTPPYAVRLLLDFLPKGITVWDPAAGEGYLAMILMEAGYKVIQTDIKTGTDFITCQPNFHFDAIITNPPYQGALKYKFIVRCYELCQLWALLMQADTRYNKKPGVLFEQNGVQVIDPVERIDFFMPDNGYKDGGANFKTLWFTSGLLERDHRVPVVKPSQEEVIAEVERLKATYLKRFKPVRGITWTQPMLMGV